MIDSDGHIKINLCKTAQSLEQSLLSQTSGSSFADFKDNKNSISRKSNFIAPEVLNNESYSSIADWWSLGAMIHQMISGYPPFLNSSYIINNQIRFSKNLSSNLKCLLEGLLQPDPLKRLGSNGIFEILNHKYFQDISWDDFKNKQIKVPFTPKLKSRVSLHTEDSSESEGSYESS